MYTKVVYKRGFVLVCECFEGSWLDSGGLKSLV